MSSIIDDNGIGLVFKLRDEIRILQNKITSIQEQCSHPKEAVTEKAGASTGHWCPGDDSYWVDKHCHLCDKRWRVDQ